ncbi:MAG: hypothetical protein KF760_34055 [Candidatus Eremiobacteraeota bacterium]|nr:hypothetical protein [Candidatus Eremiobacteraeota bacterium]MCW5869352.1 hypothetical protein [Candidatus Eremiobacteraeota bacterium]
MNASHYHAIRDALASKAFTQADGSPWPTAVLDAEILELSGLERYSEHVRVLQGFKGSDTLTAMVF